MAACSSLHGLSSAIQTAGIRKIVNPSLLMTFMDHPRKPGGRSFLSFNGSCYEQCNSHDVTASLLPIHFYRNCVHRKRVSRSCSRTCEFYVVLGHQLKVSRLSVYAVCGFVFTRLYVL